MNEVDAHLIADGSRAEAALHYLTPVFDALRSEAMARWNASGLDQAALREKLFLSVRAINAAEQSIRSVIQQAEAAEAIADHPDLQVFARNALAAEGLTRP